MEFEELLALHKRNINDALKIVSDEIINKASLHDMDKLDNKEIYDVYKEHFKTLKSIPFGTDEYKKYQISYMEYAQRLHAQNNRHHFYDFRNTMNDINLLDFIEAVVDIYVSQKQYEGYNSEKYLLSLERRGILDMSLRDLISNTIQFIESKSDEENI